MKIGILGGGVAGINVARLLDTCHDVTVLEAETQTGGLARSFEYCGFNYDIGPHIIFSKNKEVLKYMLDTDPNLVAHHRSNQIWYKGCLIKYPFENYLGQLPLEERQQCVDYFIDNPYAEYEPANMLQFFLTNFGAGITNVYLRPYNEKIWKYDPAFLDLQMVGRIPKPPVEDILSGAKGEPKEGYTHQLEFYYPRRGGIKSFFDKMVERMPKNSRLLSSHKVVAITSVHGREWEVRCENGSSFLFDRIVNCMPLHHFMPALQIDVPVNVSAAFKALKYNSLYYGVAIFSEDTAGHNFSLNIPSSDIIFHRISKLNFLGDEHPVGHSAFLFEITFTKGMPLATLDADAIQEAVIVGFEHMGLASRTHLVAFDLRKVEHAYVIYDLSHRKNIDIVLGFLREHNIECCGRFAEFEYLNMDHVIERAMRLTNTLNQRWAV